MQHKMLVACLAVVGLSASATAGALSPEEALGKMIYFDQSLSYNGNLSCAGCHAPESGFTGPLSATNASGAVYEGSVPGRFGNRKPPSAAYATLSPILHYVMQQKQAVFMGGNFWNGRATGEKLGNPAADQAQGPFLNPLEQALATPGDVVTGVCSGFYADLFTSVWGESVCLPENVESAFDAIALSIAAYEASNEVNAFTSKYDYYLQGRAELTKEERKGLDLFKGKGKCANCHVLNEGTDGTPPLLTDYTFDNLGVPRNPENPFYTQDAQYNPLGYAWTDRGLGEFLATRMDYAAFAAENEGKQKVPTLRNVDKRPDALFVKAYTHNGYFKSLKSIVHFYNTRDVLPRCGDAMTTEADAMAQGCWPAPEVPENINTKELGDLHLTGEQEDAIVAFLKTLSDGYQP
ncbi:cytochrome-c peroxidase [Sulfurimonas diazotrophicus]|uniref:Cytochrome c peroxidase n=1 Tax=Sulfurimonas diazotrophicus TaxID=3131939 RepID=A0ABZ3H8X2_9BACT